MPEVRAKALREEQEKKKKELKAVEGAKILEKAASESLKKKQEAQKKREAELKKQQDDVDSLRKQGHDLLRVAIEQEEEIRRRQKNGGQNDTEVCGQSYPKCCKTTFVLRFRFSFTQKF